MMYQKSKQFFILLILVQNMQALYFLNTDLINEPEAEGVVMMAQAHIGIPKRPSGWTLFNNRLPNYAYCSGTMELVYSRRSRQKTFFKITQQGSGDRILPLIFNKLQPKINLSRRKFQVINNGHCCWKIYAS